MSVIFLEYVHMWQFYIVFNLNTNFQFKLFDIAVTLKYGQGQQEWHEQGKLNK